MIKGIVFDLDHTLFDRYATLNEVAKNIRLKLPVNPNLSDSKIAEIMISADKLKVHRGWDEMERYIIEETPLFSEKLPKYSYQSFILEQFHNIAVEFPFVKPMLESFKSQGYKLGVITNGRSGLQEKKIQMIGLEGIFDEVIVGGQYGCPKPSTEPFLMMADRLNLSPNEMLYVGDNPINDVDASRKAGYIPVYVNTVGSWRIPEIQQCEFQIESVKDLPELLEKIK